MTVRVTPVRTPDDLMAVRGLFRAYADWLGPVLNGPVFEVEFAGLPGAYAPPSGGLLLALLPDGTPAGCVAVRKLQLPSTCEIKRLFVLDAARGTGAGRALMEGALAFASSAGYRQVVLDTRPDMLAAQALYARLGFQSVPAYYEGALPETLFYAKQLEREQNDLG